MAWSDSVDKYLYAQATPLTADLPADANEAYADYLGPIWNRLGYGDSLAVDKADVGPPTTPLTANLDADGLGGYADSYYTGYGFNFVEAKAVQQDSITIDFRAAISVTLTEPKDIQADDIAKDFRANLSVPLADSQGVQVDSLDVTFRGALSASLADSQGIHVDALGIGYGFKFVDAKDAFADELDDVFFRFFAGLSDSQGIQVDAIATDYRANISVSLSDANEVYGDSVSYAGQSDIPVSISDSLNAWNDSVSNALTGLLSVNLSDTIGTLGDSNAQRLTHAAGISDSLNAWNDSVAYAQGLRYGLTEAILINESYLDSIAARFTFAAGLSDSQGVQSDNVDKYLFEQSTVPLTVTLFDTWRESPATEIPVTLSDSNVAYTDSFAAFEALLFRATDTRRSYPSAEAITKLLSESNGAYGDSIGLIEGLRYQLSDTWREGAYALRVTLSDANEVYEESLDVNTTDIDIKLYESKPAYSDSVGWTHGLGFEVKEPTEIVWTVSNISGGAIEGYRVYRGISPSTYTAYYQIPNPATLSVPIRLAVPPGDWYVAIAAYNSTGISAYSNELHIQYAEFGDSVTASTRSINFTDPKPQFVDGIVARLPFFASVGADDLNTFADAGAVRINLRAGLSDDITNLGDSVGFSTGSNLKPGYFESLSVPVDSIQAELTYSANLNDSYNTLSDAANTELGEYVTLEISVDLDDGLNNWVDNLLNDVFNLTDLRIPITEDALVYADSIAGGMSFSASRTDALGGYSDSFVWSGLVWQTILNDAIPSKNDNVSFALGIASKVDLPGIDFDVAASPWLSLADDNTWKPVEYPADVDI